MTAIQDVSVPVNPETIGFDDINGNWNEVQEFLMTDSQARGETEPDLLYRTIEANARAAQIALFGGQVQLVDAEQNRSLTSMPTRGGTVARVFWWGFHIQISHEDVQAIINFTDGVKTLVDILAGVVPGVIRPFLAPVRIFLDVAKAVFRALDRGRGVYISMSWFAPGIFVPTTV